MKIASRQEAIFIKVLNRRVKVHPHVLTICMEVNTGIFSRFWPLFVPIPSEAQLNCRERDEGQELIVMFPPFDPSLGILFVTSHWIRATAGRGLGDKSEKLSDTYTGITANTSGIANSSYRVGFRCASGSSPSVLGFWK